MAESPETSQLVAELVAVARKLSPDEAAAQRLLETIAADVNRYLREPLTLFPVIHHSPASALHMVRYLRQRQPRLVFIELSSDLIGLVESLRDCRLPVALQAYAADPVGFPEGWAPLAVVAPLTELSAEYQAIAYALQTPGVELVFVDRDVDKVFTWMDPADNPLTPEPDEDDGDPDDDTTRLHGQAVGLEVGALTASFADFTHVLLQNARMSHLSEWTALYIEEPTLGADTHAYREVMGFVGALFRRLGASEHHREETRRRDRLMWTRIKDALSERRVAPSEAVFICGAAHIVADDCPEWGSESPHRFEDEALLCPSGTTWKYGFIPSSYGAIEHQFHHPRGAISIAEGLWRRALSRWKVEPFTLVPPKALREADGEAADPDISKTKTSKGSGRTGKTSPRAAKAQAPIPEQLGLRAILFDPPSLTEADEDELIRWCSGIVSEARKARYLASTADAIAIYETAILLARMRSRRRPSPYDFMDAAETCLEKDRVPGRRNIRALCHRLLGGDRVGQIGYSSLPPLVQDVYDRLAPVGIHAQNTRVTRVLMDFDTNPELRLVSRLLWRLHTLLPGTRVARPIMGKLELGHVPRQESWDVKLSGPEQREVIELGFSGVSVEQVLERQLSDRAHKEGASTLSALEAAESALILLERSRLHETLGERAIILLQTELGADDASAIFALARRLVAYFRTQPEGLPGWLSRFIASGYETYTARLPRAFGDRGTSPAQLGGMLAFIFTLESLALAMGCQRSQLLIALEQARLEAADPEKLGLLWAAEWLTQLRDEASLLEAFDLILEHPIGRRAYPRYLSGFLRALTFSPRAAPIAVSLIGKAFATLPDHVVLPWMPGLLTTLQEQASDVVPALFAELARHLPRPGAEWAPP
ncbi:MAG TPA: DUF5682 family protein, partial [Myxococcota bacterium]|nr:DUF5682 family protein [Myxococcota bacterium]